jgi:hypothetical protein
MAGGAFQTSRDIFNHSIWHDIPKFRIFFYIYGNAVFSEEGVTIGSVHLKRGQYLRSYRNLAEDLQYIENRKIKKYSVSVISRKIEQLIKEERLKIEDTELGTLFTVVNYQQYQGFDGYKKKELGTELEQSWNGAGTELEQSGNNNNNVKKVKKDKSSNPSSKDDELLKNEFNRFWDIYPKKVDKKKAFEKFKTSSKEHGTDKIIEGAEKYAKECEVKKTEKQFIKHATTFLNAESFLNEFEVNIGTHKKDNVITYKPLDLEDL